MAAIPFSFRTWSDHESAKIVVMSFYPDQVTVTCSAGTVADETPARTSIGTDEISTGGVITSFGAETTGAPTGVAVFSWIATISGLLSDSSATVSVEQNGTIRTGTIKTQLSSSDESDFTLFFISCDGRDSSATDKGCWGYIHDYAANNNVKAVIHPDDHGYTDTATVPSTSGNLRWSVSGGPSSIKKAYSYALSYAGYLGLLESTNTQTQDGVTSSDTRFLDVDRIWCFENIPLIVTPGDHEFQNNAEENTGNTAAQFAAFKECWAGMIGACQNFIDPTKANSFATRDVLGPIELICLDRISGLTALNAVYTTSTQTPTGISWLGSGQISDIYGSVDTTSKFKIIGLSMGTRSIKSKAERLSLNQAAPPNNWAFATLGAQQPLHDYTDNGTDSEWTDITTKKANNGIACKSSATYEPVIVAMHGDTHRPYEYYHYSPESSTNAKLDMYEISSGSVNGQPMHGLHTSIDTGYQYSPVTATWFPSFTTRNQLYNPSDADVASGYTDDANISTCLQVDISKSSGSWVMSIKTIQCTGADSTGSVIRTLELHDNKSNNPDYLRKGWI